MSAIDLSFFLYPDERLL